MCLPRFAFRWPSRFRSCITLARSFGSSRAGAVLDPVADKLFMAAAFLTVARSGRLHPVEIVGVLARDIVAALAFLGVWIGRRSACMRSGTTGARPRAAVGPSPRTRPERGRRGSDREADCVACDGARALG